MNAATANQAPTIGRIELFKMLPRFRRQPLESFGALFDRFGDTVCLRGLWTAFLLRHPRAVEQVLQTNSRNYPKSASYKVIKDSTGNGLFVSEGEFWLRQRRLAQPVFHRQKIQTFAATMVDATRETLVRWREYARNDQTFDVAPEMMRLTLDIVGRSLFSRGLSENRETFADAFETVRQYTLARMTGVLPIPKAAPTPLNLRLRRALESVDCIVYDLIEQRRKQPDKFDDLLAMLLRAIDADTGETMSDQQLRDETLTLIGAGYETTTTALAWTFYLLGTHPEAEIRLRDEIETVLGGREPTIEDLPKLVFTLQVFQESLRLFPPVWGLLRAAKEPDEIGGFQIPARSEILLFPYFTHRHPEFWDAPDRFKPERFAPEETQKRPKFAYFGFGGGARQCIGNNFAQMEATIIVAMIVQRYRFRLIEAEKVEPEFSVTLRPRDGVKIRLQETQ